MLLVVDNGSVYTKHLTDFLTNKINFEVLTHDKVKLSNLNNYNSFILSGRRKNDQLMNSINSKIIKHSIQKTRANGANLHGPDPPWPPGVAGQPLGHVSNPFA